MLQKQGYVPAWLASRLACKFNSTMRKTFLFWQIAIIVCFKTWNLIHRKHIQDALGAADIVPVFFLIICLCPDVKTVTGISVFAAEIWNIFTTEGKMPSLSLWNRHPAISHSVTLSYPKMFYVKLAVFTATACIKLHELTELPQIWNVEL